MKEAALLLTLSIGLFSMHHSARLLISSRYELSSFLHTLQKGSVSVQWEQKGAEHTALGCSSVER